jgi:uncharacterized protein YyaL (SSP411 family)
MLFPTKLVEIVLPPGPYAGREETRRGTLDPKKSANRLGREKSPYLRQHARNPVDWNPWGSEAFERAKKEDKPVFLSVGYSTCHWCHVMERESFDDEEAARVLNETFVCIKVDREERPDLDQYYMSVCQAMTGSGGWPLTIIMTPDKEPFFAGTYFPKTERWGRPGLMEIAPRVRELWTTRREDVLRSAGEITRAAHSERASKSLSTETSSAVLDEALGRLATDFDEAHGGFGGAPKFPAPHNLAFLLRMWKRTGRGDALEMVDRTLSAMRRGGLYDQLGFGFHRYSTDARWLVPHFEKMLYDQARLSRVYADAYLVTGKEEFRRTAFEILDYVLRDLTSPEGAFYSAEDADSEGEEGLFYLWTEKEIREVLGQNDSALALETFNVRTEGNFNEPGRGPNGRNILHLTPPEDAIRGFSPKGGTGEVPAHKKAPPKKSGTEPRPSPLTLEDQLDRHRARLFLSREKRIHPFKDTKILTDWNGLMIAALAAAARITDDPRYLEAAVKAARFLLDKTRDREGRLFHVYSEGEARIPGFVDDYAFFIHGLVELHQTTFDPEYLRQALALLEAAKALFWDGRKGGFFFVPPDSELPFRKKELYDGAIPSGNSAMLMNLVRLARLTGNAGLEGMASEMATAFASEIGAHPRAFTAFLSGLDFAFGPSHEVVVVGRLDEEATRDLLKAVNGGYLPNVVVLFKPAEEPGPSLAEIAPFTEPMKPVDGRPAAYVCTGGRCLKPVMSPEELTRILNTLG